MRTEDLTGGELVAERDTARTVKPDASVPGKDRAFIVVGGGPAGARAAQELALRSERPVRLFSDENWGPYNRVKLTPLLAREVNLGQVCDSLDLPSANQVERIDGCRIVSIDRAAHTVRDHLGRDWPYEKLVLATGSRPHRPNIPGIQVAGVFTFRHLNDAQALMARVLSSRQAVVIGGGLLGLEAARGLRARGANVIVVEHESHLMARQLDPGAGDVLKAEIEDLGIGVRTGVAVQQIVGALRVEGLHLSSGEVIECDTVVLCTGIRPNRELAQEAGLEFGQGVRVDDHLTTSDPDIFAIGECAQHEGVIDGLVAPGLEQARIAALSALGEDASYRRAPPTTRLKVAGVAVFSAGDVEQLDDRSDVTTATWAAEDGVAYRRLVLRKGRLVGALAVGEWADIGQIQQALARQARFLPPRLWKFSKTGRLFPDAGVIPVSVWPDAATVCNCTSVTRGQLGAAIEAGCNTVEALARETSASMVCGTCKPLLQELLGSDAPPEPNKLWRTLLGLSAAAVLGVLAYLILRPTPVAESFSSGFTLDKLFLDNLLKQISGYSLLGLAAAAAVLSLRKRISWFKLGGFDGWRLVHLIIGLLTLSVLAAHTGFRLGENLNQALIITFLAVLAAGALGGAMIGLEHRLAGIPAVKARRLNPRKLSIWLHILTVWPLPALLVLHIVGVYFY